MDKITPETTAADEMYCKGCGKIIKKSAAFCPYCGTQLGSVQAETTNKAASREKYIALLLAIFLGFFAWLYTYKKDAWKFWVSLAITLINVVLFFITLGIWGLVAWLWGPISWIWVIVDVAVKPDEYYKNYDL
jgi:uncharacterized membrane protein